MVNSPGLSESPNIVHRGIKRAHKRPRGNANNIATSCTAMSHIRGEQFRAHLWNEDGWIAVMIEPGRLRLRYTTVQKMESLLIDSRE